MLILHAVDMLMPKQFLKVKKRRLYAIIDALDTFRVDEQERYLILLASCIVIQIGNIVVGQEETFVNIARIQDELMI